MPGVTLVGMTETTQRDDLGVRDRELVNAHCRRAEDAVRQLPGGAGHAYASGVVAALAWVSGESDVAPGSGRRRVFTEGRLLDERVLLVRAANAPLDERDQRMGALGRLRALEWVLGSEFDPFTDIPPEASNILLQRVEEEDPAVRLMAQARAWQV